MSDDDLQLIMSLGGAFYRCENGHPFYIDGCGKPMAQSVCNICKSGIGESGHNFIFKNPKINQSEDKSPKGYAIQRYSRNSPSYTVRSRTVTFLWIQTFIVHLCLCLSEFENEKSLEHLFSFHLQETPTNHILEQLLLDWNILIEVTQLSPESLASKLIHVLPDVVLKLFRFERLSTVQERNIWEQQFDKDLKSLWDKAAPNTFLQTLLHYSQITMLI